MPTVFLFVRSSVPPKANLLRPLNKSVEAMSPATKHIVQKLKTMVPKEDAGLSQPFWGSQKVPVGVTFSHVTFKVKRCPLTKVYLLPGGLQPTH